VCLAEAAQRETQVAPHIFDPGQRISPASGGRFRTMGASSTRMAMGRAVCGYRHAVVRMSSQAGTFANAARKLAKQMAPPIPASVTMSIMPVVDNLRPSRKRWNRSVSPAYR
jgi:hypothetical protein